MALAIDNLSANDPETHSPWPLCTAATTLLESWLSEFLSRNPALQAMSDRFLRGAGVRLYNLVDSWIVSDAHTERLRASGFVAQSVDGEVVWTHPAGRLARVRVDREIGAPVLAIACEDVATFLSANALTFLSRSGDPDSDLEEARCSLPYGELAIVARRGYAGFQPGSLDARGRERLDHARRALQERDRTGGDTAAAERAADLVLSAASDLGLPRAVDEFFAQERQFYMRRNAAARWMYGKQRELGFEWANHDHHTYRSSRVGFGALVRLWARLGFTGRERYYAGDEAGWGAQILEHPVSRIVIFSDVDIAAEELHVDFGSEELPARAPLGTIGLWCELHGGSIAKAGMHHLEAEYDFERATEHLIAAGYGVMPPFTDLPMLKQAFTEAQTWPVLAGTLDRLTEQGLITREQAARFAEHGAPGSHLEILQRWQGFKGFNKTGVSSIIRDTDARRLAAH